jgi:ribosome-binding factor A
MSARSGRAPSQRARRMGEVVRHALAEVLARGDLRDPDLTGVAITVTEVRPSQDLKSATVFVTPLGGVGDIDLIVKALKRARGHLRAEVGHMVEAKFTPELRFVADTAFEQSQRLSEVLRDVAARDADRSTGEDPEQNDGA